MGHKKLVSADPSENYPEFLRNANTLSTKSNSTIRPLIITPNDNNSVRELEELLRDEKVFSIIDNYAEQYAELLLSKNAHIYQANYEVQVASVRKLLEEHYSGKNEWELGSWVYYPWSGNLVHVLGRENFEELRTIRNRDLITRDEQHILKNFEVACFGMSVGSASALSLTITGISDKIKLIDDAVISGSNLNRILTGVANVGKGKNLAIGQTLYEMNPYIDVEYFKKVDTKNIKDVFDNPWPIKLVVDEIDDIEMKVQIRIEAKKRKIPVLMATELGDTVMLDIERFDLEPNRPIFHDIIPGIENSAQEKISNQREWMKRAVKIIDPYNMPVKMQESLLKIGSTIVTHPQLGSTVMMTGGVVTFAVKKIALKEELNSGRYTISLEKEILPEHSTRAYKKHHKKHTEIILKAINSM
jgi:molybdopterin/thiamine biosynthesis adenylyltransferase